jgi:cytoskeletal protein CcmA (bactofilin family)
MPPSKQDKVPVPCPHCGHSQLVPPTAVSSVCKGCGEHFHVQEALNPKPKKVAKAPELRTIHCFDCGTELKVPVAAESTMCKRCSTHIDLRDYSFANAVSKNFRTKGSFVVEQKGYVFNTEALVGEAVIKGRFLGKLKAERTLTIHTGAEIKGTFTAGMLVIPAKNRFYWGETINVVSAEISGELSADINASETIIVKSTGVYFGNAQAQNMIVEPGAVVVGEMRIGPKPPPPPAPALADLPPRPKAVANSSAPLALSPPPPPAPPPPLAPAPAPAPKKTTRRTTKKSDSQNKLDL